MIQNRQEADASTPCLDVVYVVSESCVSCRRHVVRSYASSNERTDGGGRLVPNDLRFLVSSKFFIFLSLDCYSKQVAKPATAGGNEDSDCSRLALLYDYA